MIGKTAKFGASFIGAIEYCYYAVRPNRSLDRTQVRGELLYFQHVAPGLTADPMVANILGGERLHIEALARQFAEVARRNGRVEKPVWHQVFSFPIEPTMNKATPGRSTMASIAQDFAYVFGLVNNPMVVFRHSEKDHDHFHIIASRVDTNGVNTAQTAHNYRRVGQFCRNMEEKYNLTPTRPMVSLEPASTQVSHNSDSEPQQTSITVADKNHNGRRMLKTDKVALRQAIDQAILGSRSLAGFCQRLAESSPYYVSFVPYTDRRGQPCEGIAYKRQGDATYPATPGYALGRDYVFGRIVERTEAAGRTNSLTSAPQPTTESTERMTSLGGKISANTISEIAPTLPFAGTAAKHESDIERDIARISRSLNQVLKGHGEADAKPTKGVLPKAPVRKNKRHKGL